MILGYEWSRQCPTDGVKPRRYSDCEGAAERFGEEYEPGTGPERETGESRDVDPDIELETEGERYGD